MKSVIIRVKKGGEYRVEAVGYKGIGCEKDVKSISDALGGSTQSIQKPERFVQEVQQQKIGGGR